MEADDGTWRRACFVLYHLNSFSSEFALIGSSLLVGIVCVRREGGFFRSPLLVSA